MINHLKVCEIEPPDDEPKQLPAPKFPDDVDRLYKHKMLIDYILSLGLMIVDHHFDVDHDGEFATKIRYRDLANLMTFDLMVR